MHSSPLRRELRRHRSGRISASLLERTLGRELNRLLDERQALLAELGEDRQLVWGTLQRLDDETAAAARHLRTIEHRRSLDQLERAHRTLTLLGESKEAVVEARTLHSDYLRLTAALGLDPASELPTLRLVPRLLDRARGLVGEGRPGRARALLRSARRELAEILQGSPEGSEGTLAERVRDVARRLRLPGGLLTALVRAAGARHGLLLDRLLIELEALHPDHTASPAERGTEPRSRRTRTELAELAERARRLRVYIGNGPE